MESSRWPITNSIFCSFPVSIYYITPYGICRNFCRTTALNLFWMDCQFDISKVRLMCTFPVLMVAIGILTYGTRISKRLGGTIWFLENIKRGGSKDKGGIWWKHTDSNWSSCGGKYRFSSYYIYLVFNAKKRNQISYNIGVYRLNKNQTKKQMHTHSAVLFS